MATVTDAAMRSKKFIYARCELVKVGVNVVADERLLKAHYLSLCKVAQRK